MFQTKVVKKIKTHMLCSLTPPLPENHAVYEVMWKSIVEPDRPAITIWRVLNACLFTNTRSEYAVAIAFPLQQCLQERPCMLRYTYIACFI